MRKITLSMLVPVLSFCMAWADDITPQQAASVAQEFFKHHGLAGVEASSPRRVAMRSESEQAESTPYYVFNSGDGRGYVIVSGDDRTRQVLAYGLDGSFDADEIAPGARYLLDIYERQIEALRNGAEPAEVRSEAAGGERLLVTAEWNQSYDFWWSKCPKVNGKPTHAGCVPAAMAILMRYYEWPKHGYGSHSYVSQPRNIALSVDFEQTDYMLDKLPLGNQGSHEWTDEKKEAVATLLHHCGVATEVQYDIDGSGTHSAEYALFKYFGYKFGQSISRDDLDDDERWYAILREEIDAGRPMLYSGNNGAGSGHSFICDGYDASGMFHFNFGWSGSNNGFYSLDYIAKEGKNYTHNQFATIHIVPDYEANGVPAEQLYMKESMTAPAGLYLNYDTIRPDMVFSAIPYGLTSLTHGAYDVKIGLFLCDKSGKTKRLLGTNEIHKFHYTTTYKDGYRIYGCVLPGDADVESTDRLYVFSSLDGGATWTKVSCRNKDIEYVAISDCYDPSPFEQQLVMREKEGAMGLTLEDTEIHPDKRFKVMINGLENKYLLEFTGDVAIFLCDKNGNRKQRLGATRVEELKNGESYIRKGFYSSLTTDMDMESTDRLYAFTSTDDGVTWHKIACDKPELEYIALADCYDPTPVHINLSVFDEADEQRGLAVDELDGVVTTDKRFTVHAYNMQNVTMVDFTGEMAMFVCTADGERMAKIGSANLNGLKPGSYYRDYGFSCTIPATLHLNATDRICLFSKHEGSDTWLMVCCDEEEKSYVSLSEAMAVGIDAMIYSVSGSTEYYDMNGILYHTLTTHPGIYIEKRGGAIKKLIIR